MPRGLPQLVEEAIAEDELLDFLRHEEREEDEWKGWKEEELDLGERYSTARLGVGGAVWPGRG